MYSIMILALIAIVCMSIFFTIEDWHRGSR